jgi:hypothetical protein
LFRAQIKLNFALFGWTWFYLSAIMGIFTITNYIFSVTLTVERERIRMVAAWQPLGSHVQSPPPLYDGGEEHLGFLTRSKQRKLSR